MTRVPKGRKEGSRWQARSARPPDHRPIILRPGRGAGGCSGAPAGARFLTYMTGGCAFGLPPATFCSASGAGSVSSLIIIVALRPAEPQDDGLASVGLLTAFFLVQLPARWWSSQVAGKW